MCVNKKRKKTARERKEMAIRIAIDRAMFATRGMLDMRTADAIMHFLMNPQRTDRKTKTE